MVMKKNAMRKNLTQSIRRSLGRYIAIVTIIALGASIFVGLLMTKTDMVATGQKYMDEQNMFDLRLMNSYGWELDDLDAVKEFPGIVDAEGVMYTDIIVRLNGQDDDLVYRFYAMPENINRYVLRGGRLPQRPDECLADGYHADDSILGTTVTVSDANDAEAAEGLRYKTFTVVGYVSTPLYMDMNRGTTSVGSGSLSNYLMIPRESMDLDYYAEIHVTLPGEYDVYTERYNTAMEDSADALEPLLQPMADQRLDKIREEAWKSYDQGMTDYQEGLEEFLQEKDKALQELEDAYNLLLEAEQTIADSEKQIARGKALLADGWAQLRAGEQELEEGKAQLEGLKSSLLGPVDAAQKALQEDYDAATARRDALDGEIQAIDSRIASIRAEHAEQTAGLDAVESQLRNARNQINSLNSAIYAAQALRATLAIAPELNAEWIAQLDASIARMQQELSQYEAMIPALEGEKTRLETELQEPLARISELEAQKEPLTAERNMLQLSIDSMKPTLDGILAARQEAEALFAESEAEILAGEAQLKEARAQLSYQQGVLDQGEKDLEAGKKELEEGWKEYEEGKAEFEAEIAKAQQELDDAKSQLEEAYEILISMKKNDVIILDRNSNIGYNSLDSASDIVQGVSRVFPAFFLLVASLVCITTMTRMIDEERTQIGTLKALGYSNGRIISKYLIYAGSGAVVGCGLGVLLGSVVFPVILWEAYKIMLYITDSIVLRINWWLCAAVVGTYTAVMLLVTWYCCRKALREEPAELIRPKAPDAGRKIFLEYLPFWRRLSFLNKVTLRNIFRYRQRLAMMLVGIGGCTALLVTGFGLRDSIVNVVDYQFQEVTTYDMSVYFADGQTPEEQADFLHDLEEKAENILFYHQSSMELEFEGGTREIYMIAAGEGITEFVDLHVDNEKILVPGVNEVVISVGAAEMMGIRVGDTVKMRNADLETLELTVSGIYDNHVQNYAIIHPDTIAHQWGEPAPEQMAFVKVGDDRDAYSLSAEITGFSDVMNVQVSRDFANMVSNMMDALDLVVWVIVVCAGALAATVLYNLTNININERIREIATIKVLGFNARETAMYVFKENLALTVIGSALGLGLGYLLLLFVMSQIRIDMVYFKALVMPLSYVIAIVLTVLAACIVCFVFYFKLDKINMAEALKSVE